MLAVWSAAVPVLALQ
ncbi:hypothetical protein Nmel_011770 [Mimus melanotis]